MIMLVKTAKVSVAIMVSMIMENRIKKEWEY